MIRRSILWLVLSLAPTACRESNPPTPERVELRLARRAGGRIGLELVGAKDAPRALQATLVVRGSGTFTFDDARPPSGLPLDTVRLGSAGANRAIVFAGDKRGVRLPASGDVATFLVGPSGGDGLLSIESAVVASNAGVPLEVSFGPSVSVR